MDSNRCAICQHRGTIKKPLDNFATILCAMGYLATNAHGECIKRIQQKALQFRNRLTRRIK